MKMKQIPFLLILGVMCFNASAQNDTIGKSYKTDNQVNPAGFYLGLNQVLGNSKNAQGIQLGAESSYLISNHLFLSFQPCLSLNSLISEQTGQTIEKSFLEVPVYLLLAPKIDHFNPIFAIGPDYKFDLKQINQSALAINAIIGYKIRFRYFTFIPDILYSWSANIKALYISLHFTGGYY